MNQSRFENILRITVTPNFHEEEATESYLDFCLKYGFHDVAFFLNNEENCLGQITIEQAKPWVKAIKKAAKVFRDHGIGVQLNPWMEIGHLDRGGYEVPEGVSFQTVVSPEGGQERIVACPLDEVWWNFFSPVYSYILREIQPDLVWIEDDFRLHNHGDYFFTCFCPHHMKRFNEKLGTNYTREQFVDLVFHKGDMQAKKAMLDVFRDTMNEFSLKLGKLIKEASPHTKVGLMSSRPEAHCYEARDWGTVVRNLAQGGPIIQRPHLPGYYEDSGKNYYEQFNSVTMPIRAFLPKEAEIYPELENAACLVPYGKDPRYVGFMLEGSLPLCPSGMTYDIMSFVGNGADEEWGYGEIVKTLQPYLDSAVREGLSFSDHEGVVIPLDPNACYHRRGIKKIEEILPDEFESSSYLASLGISTKISLEKRTHGQTVFLVGSMVDNFSDEELTALFQDNAVIIEGGAIMKMFERGLQGLLHARSYTLHPAQKDSQAYDQYLGDEEINGVKHRRESLFRTGDYLRIEYEEGEAKVFAEAFDTRHHGLGPTYAQVGRTYLIPFEMRHRRYGQYLDTRTFLLNRFVFEQCPRVVLTHRPGVYAYFFFGDKKHVLLVNSTVTSFTSYSFSLKGSEFHRIESLGRDGTWHEADFERKGSLVAIDEPLDYLSSALLRLK